jgi:hypothetical protein
VSDANPGTDLGSVLRAVARKLVAEHRFEEPTDRAALAADVRRRLADVGPLEAFCEWVERCPEARDVLAGFGLLWTPAADEREPAVAADPRNQVRVEMGRRGDYVDCEVVAAAGNAWGQVRELRAARPGAGRRIAFVCAAAVHPQDRDAFHAILAHLPGADGGVVWEDGSPVVAPEAKRGA